MGLGSIVEYEKLRSTAKSVYSIVEENITQRMLAARDVKYKKSLSKQDREDLELLVYSVFSNINLEDDVDNGLIETMLSEPRINGTVDRFVSELIDDDSSASERRDARIIALARYHLGEENV